MSNDVVALMRELGGGGEAKLNLARSTCAQRLPAMCYALFSWPSGVCSSRFLCVSVRTLYPISVQALAALQCSTACAVRGDAPLLMLPGQGAQGQALRLQCQGWPFDA